MSDVDILAPCEDTSPTGQSLDGHLREMSMMRPSDIKEQRARTLTAKLSLPHQGFVLGRPRLRALVEPVRGGGVVYMVAGPGYGKTAFIVDLLTSAGGQTVYYSVDESDRDPVRFLTYLMAGLGVEPSGRLPSPSLGWSERGRNDGAVLDLAAEVVDFMSDRAGQTTLVAIDDLHLIDSSSPALGAIELITRGLPPGWTILFSSRRRVPLRLDEVVLGGRLIWLKGRELRLTPREVAAWARQNWAVHLQPSEARALWRVTEGWPAALALLGQHLLSRGVDVTRKDIVGVISRGRDLRAYLERHILSGLDPLAAQTMLAAALLPRVIFPRDVAFLPGLPGQAEAMLEEFVSRSFLVTRAGHRSYTVHPLVRAFAEREARRSDRTTGLIGQAAEHLERSGENHQAASLYLRSGQLQDAVRPLRALALSSLNAAVNFASDDWLDLIPDGTNADGPTDPWLLVAKARVLQRQTRYADAGVLYERAARLLSAAGDKEGLLPVLLGSAFCLFNQGLWDESLAVMKRCRSLAGSREEKVEALMAEGNVLVSLCRWDEAVENWERALALAPACGRVSLTQRVHFYRARLFYSMGRYRLARQWIEKAIDAEAGRLAPGRAVALNGAAILAYLTGDYEQAGRYADECLRLARTRGHAFVEASSLLNQAAVALGRWEYREALAKIREAQALAAKAGDAEESFWAEDMLGDLCRRNQNAQRALEHHQMALEIVDKNRLAVFERVRALAAIGMDLILLDREAEARISLEETVRISRRWSLVSSLAPALFYLGWLYARAGREQEAARSLAEAMRAAAEHEHVHFFSQEASVAVPILALCDRFEAGSFVREKLIPLLPGRLQDYFHNLTAGRTYPTDVPLGPPRRRALAPQAPAPAPTDQLTPAMLEGAQALTDREREVLKLIALGMSNKAIGAELFISEKTVKTHANHIFRKLGVASRLQATLVFQSYQRARRIGHGGRRGRQ
ncbi:MAG: LuxR C-terminal-related transcriptional regulator [bacterium]